MHSFRPATHQYLIDMDQVVVFVAIVVIAFVAFAVHKFWFNILYYHYCHYLKKVCLIMVNVFQ